MSVLIDAGNCDPENLEVAASYRRVREAVFAFQPQQQELPDGEEEDDPPGSSVPAGRPIVPMAQKELLTPRLLPPALHTREKTSSRASFVGRSRRLHCVPSFATPMRHCDSPIALPVLLRLWVLQALLSASLAQSSSTG